MAFYMKIDGIKGNVTSKGYEGWIELESIGLGIARKITASPGRVMDREATVPGFREMTVLKKVDCSSPYLFTAGCAGKSKGTAKIHACRTGDSITPYLEYTLDDVILSNYNLIGVGNSHSKSINEAEVQETLSLNFTKVEMKYIGMDASGKSQSPAASGYDLKTAEII